ncbi:MAG TPA: urease accessory protein UreF [Candidatus Obscuribacterales bacterium]
MTASAQLLTLLQLASPTLPVGAYSYSEGIETLAAQGKIATGDDLQRWLCDELTWGSIRVETAIMGWVYEAAARPDMAPILGWNDWLSAFREAEELRSQSWQMGRSLLRLFADLDPTDGAQLPPELRTGNCHFAIAYGLVAQAWAVPLPEATLAYLHSWAANLISAAVRTVPLGQTEGQRLLRQLAAPIQQSCGDIAAMTAADVSACGWGVALASMQHETQYSRLFRS